MRAFFSLHKLKNPAAFHAWLLGIAGRVALEFQRTQFRRKEVPSLENHLASPSPDLAQADDDATLDEAIAALPEPQRELILMRYFQQLSCQEIADRQRMPLGTVTKTLSRAYAALRELIEARETNPASSGENIMNCIDCRDYFAARTEQLLDSNTAIDYECHLALCADCRAHVAATEAVCHRLTAHAAAGAAVSLAMPVMRRIQERRAPDRPVAPIARISRWWIGVGAAAAASPRCSSPH